jgi:hypothetical protein
MNVYTHLPVNRPEQDKQDHTVITVPYGWSVPLTKWTQLAAGKTAVGSCTVLRMPCILFSERSRDDLPALREAAASLQLSPRMKTASASLLQALQQWAVRTRPDLSTAFRFDGLHLRAEADANIWGMPLDRTAQALAAMQKVKTAKAPVYIASGVFGYANEWQAQILGKLDEEFGETKTEGGAAQDAAEAGGKCCGYVHKGQLLPADLQKALNEIELSLLDLDALVHAHAFAGFGMSSFSFAVAEMRRLSDRQKQQQGLEARRDMSEAAMQAALETGGRRANEFYGPVEVLFLEDGVFSDESQLKAKVQTATFMEQEPMAEAMLKDLY